jgi:phage terminase Nu1 subunit (DNA packaging protein)
MARTEPASAQPLHGGEAAGTITIDVAAKLLMVTPEWVRRLTKDGWISKADRGRYRVVDVVQGYIRFLRDEARRFSKSAAHSRLQDILARKEELNIAQTERELVPLADAMTLVDEIAGTVVARVNAIPARMTRNMDERARLQREVDEALAEVADRIGKLGHAFRSGQDDPAADEEEAA